MKMLTVILALVVVSIGIVAAETNLVVNADLSKFNLRTGMPTGWSNSPSLSGERIENPESKGTYCLKLSSPVANKNALWVATVLEIKLQTTYRVSCRVNVPEGQRFRVYVERNKPEFKAFNAQWERGTGQWQTVSFEFNFQEPGSQPYLVFCVNTPNECLASNFQLTQISE